MHTVAEQACTELHDEKEKNKKDDLSICNATGYNDNKKGAYPEDMHLIVPRGFEPLLPG